MRIKIVLSITIIVTTILLFCGLYEKSNYEDFNRMNDTMDKFAVGRLSEKMVDIQVNIYNELIHDSNYILAVRCEGNEHFRFSSVTQTVSVLQVFKGNTICAGDTLDIARASNSIILQTDATPDNKYLINMGFVNFMIPGRNYLVFLDSCLEPVNGEIIYRQSSDFILSPIFCYDKIENQIPVFDETATSTYIPYTDVCNNEFFVVTIEANQKLEDLKKELIAIYPLSQ